MLSVLAHARGMGARAALQPDLTLWFDLAPEVAAARRARRRAQADRFEAQDVAFFAPRARRLCARARRGAGALRAHRRRAGHRSAQVCAADRHAADCAAVAAHGHDAAPPATRLRLCPAVAGRAAALRRCGAARPRVAGARPARRRPVRAGAGAGRRPGSAKRRRVSPTSRAVRRLRGLPACCGPHRIPTCCVLVPEALTRTARLAGPGDDEEGAVREGRRKQAEQGDPGRGGARRRRFRADAPARGPRQGGGGASGRANERRRRQRAAEDAGGAAGRDPLLLSSAAPERCCRRSAAAARRWPCALPASTTGDAPGSRGRAWPSRAVLLRRLRRPAASEALAWAQAGRRCRVVATAARRAWRAARPRRLAGWPLPQAVDALQKLCHDALAVACGAPPRYFPPTTLGAARAAAVAADAGPAS